MAKPLFRALMGMFPVILVGVMPLAAEPLHAASSGVLFRRADNVTTIGASRLYPVKKQSETSFAVTLNPSDESRNRYTFLYFDAPNAVSSAAEGVHLLLNLQNLRM